MRPNSIRAGDSFSQCKTSSFHLHFSSLSSIVIHTLGIGGRKRQSPFQNGSTRATELENLRKSYTWPCYNIGKMTSARLSEPRSWMWIVLFTSSGDYSIILRWIGSVAYAHYIRELLYTEKKRLLLDIRASLGFNLQDVGCILGKLLSVM